MIVWPTWLTILAVSFGVLEGIALKTGLFPSLSRFIWIVSKAWPPFGWVCGVVAGGLAAHFWWIGQGCDLVGK